MIFSLLKMAIWVAGVGVITYYALPFVGYQVNTAYFEERKSDCRQALDHCRKELIKSGVEGAREKCEISCVDPKILIKKKEQPSENNQL